MRGLSLIVASGGHSSSRCVGLSLSRPFPLRSTGSRHAGSVIVAHGPSRSAACGILPDQGSSPCPLPWQADSQPLHHQGSPGLFFFFFLNLFNLFIFGCVGSSFLCKGFLQLWQAGATLHCGARASIAASLVAEHRLQTRRLSSCGSRAQLLRGIWDLPRPGLEPVSPELAGAFSTTAPPGKPPGPLFNRVVCFIIIEL